MTTREAFEKILDDYDLTDKAGIKRTTIRTWRKRFNEGTITLDAMEKALIDVGAKKIVVEKWKFKKQ